MLLEAAGAVDGRAVVACPAGPLADAARSRSLAVLSPPLRSLELAPGQHTIEIRNSTFPSRLERVEVKSGEAITIRHRFR